MCRKRVRWNSTSDWREGGVSVRLGCEGRGREEEEGGLEGLPSAAPWPQLSAAQCVKSAELEQQQQQKEFLPFLVSPGILISQLSCFSVCARGNRAASPMTLVGSSL